MLREVARILAGSDVRKVLMEDNKRFEAIRDVLMSSHFSDEKLILSSEEEKALQETIKEKQVYRGVSVLRRWVTPEQFKEICELKPGDVAPSYIALNNKNRFTSATTKLSVAKQYASGGNVSLVLKAVSDKSNTWVNLANLGKTSLAEEFSEDDLEYFKQSGEVLMKPNTVFIVEQIKVHK